MLEYLLKKFFDLPENIEIKRPSFKLEEATPGKVLRTCATVHYPGTPFPYTEANWNYKICAVVVLGYKVFSFSVERLVAHKVAL